MNKNIELLKRKAASVRINVLNRVEKVKKGHIGGTFSCLDILVALYCGGILNLYRTKPHWEDRDRLYIGKGHTCLAVYELWVMLEMMDSKCLDEYGTNGGILGGQFDTRAPQSESNTGSLGHALGYAIGSALAAKMDNKNYISFALIGDGESEEGSIWESIMFASKFKLNNLVCIVDRNRLSVTEFMEDSEYTGTMEDRVRACGWECRVIDGHDFTDILSSFDNLNELKKPYMIVADTVKGKGVSFLENKLESHHSVPDKEMFKKAREEIMRSAK